MRIHDKNYEVTPVYNSQEGLLAAVGERPLASFGICAMALRMAEGEDFEALIWPTRQRFAQLITGTFIELPKKGRNYFFERPYTIQEPWKEVIEEIEQTEDGLARRLNFRPMLSLSNEPMKRLVAQALCGSREAEESLRIFAQKATNEPYGLVIHIDQKRNPDFSPQRAYIEFNSYKEKVRVLGGIHHPRRCLALVEEDA